jgi:AcrR family transcriptional regulator
VSLRTVYHHFERLADLALAALESGSTKRLRSLPDPATEGALTGRIGAFVEARGQLFDAAAGLAQATVAVGQPTRSLETAPGSRSVLRRQLERSFEEELAGPAGRLLLDAVDAVSSADTWAYLRAELGRSAPEARAIVEETLRRLLAPETRHPQAATSG